MNTKSVSGFTLLEVMVALAVIALGMAAVIKTVTTTTSNTIYLRDKTFAYWVAQNQLAEIEVTAASPKTGFTDGEEKLAGLTWHWTRKIEGTEDPDTNRIEITVRKDKDKSAQNYATLITLFFNPR
ncbi:MAG: type II secretion system minor pseudopilin GspI [Gammaproteobacteria bacterium]|nr:type II secretion system minor pseudopilin GspI [Gammaproteobacteria bacterium]MDH3608950.1 type II secretion system minor pseudopilin GspI [Gammaproteobacteria bacterium]NNC67230.1 type II secretion system minor pseudopilin GspI [Gammaproteobacteria bacterium]